MIVRLVSVPSDLGHGANDGAYYPVGLVTIGTQLLSAPFVDNVRIIDAHHHSFSELKGDVVGISASSTMNYGNALRAAEIAKNGGATVVMGGPHATQVAEQILRNRPGLVDFVVRGHGECAMAELLKALEAGSTLTNVPSLSWRTEDGDIAHNARPTYTWVYDDFQPLRFDLVDGGLEQYWRCFQRRIDPTIDAAFVVFTHFGCGYREMMMKRTPTNRALTKWCSYCSLNDPLSYRRGQDIVNEVMGLIDSFGLERGAKILLKCYGDNVGTQIGMLRELAEAIENTHRWRDYRLGWTFYAQSSRVTEELIALLRRVGTWNLFIGFDSVENRVQMLNGLGTSASTHWKAARLCKEAGIRIQAAFVMGCAGETQGSIDRTLGFAQQMAEMDLLERINVSVLFIVPGSPSYEILARREPWIRALDLLPAEELQLHWLRHFCPDLAGSPEEALGVLRCAANELDALSPGPHASMGYVSDRLRSGGPIVELARQ